MTKNSNNSKATKKDVNGHYAYVNGLKIYYEDHGAGSPLVLMHGGVGASEMFEPLMPKLAENRRVLGVHLQGHGRTIDIDRPLRFESMAEDIAALIKHLHIDQVDILGYSLGGGVALRTTIQHPELVRKLVLVSAPFQRHGFYPEVLEDMAQMGPDRGKFMGESPLAKIYPDANWPVLFGKLGDLLRRDYDWSKDVAAIQSPVMLVCADADAVRPAHVIEFFSLLGGGQRDAGLDGSARPTARLAILPGMTHYDIITFPGLTAMVTSFLDAPTPKRG
jgi:pimeloyl-ACP methyl ester carboxylesterase